jgi:hypothetical protein
MPLVFPQPLVTRRLATRRSHPPLLLILSRAAAPPTAATGARQGGGGARPSHLWRRADPHEQGRAAELPYLPASNTRRRLGEGKVGSRPLDFAGRAREGRRRRQGCGD